MTSPKGPREGTDPARQPRAVREGRSASQEDALSTWAVLFQSRSNLMGKVGPWQQLGKFLEGPE